MEPTNLVSLKSIESGADTGCVPIGLRSKVVHYGDMVQFGTQPEPLRPVLTLSVFVKKGTNDKTA